MAVIAILFLFRVIGLFFYFFYFCAVGIFFELMRFRRSFYILLRRMGGGFICWVLEGCLLGEI